MAGAGGGGRSVQREMDPRLRTGGMAALVWFGLKLMLGKQVHDSLGSILSFALLAVVSSTVGFDWQIFIGGIVAVRVVLAVLEGLLGHGVYDIIVLGLIAAYHTKPSRQSFDGRPMREMQRAMKQMKEADREARGLPPKKAPSNLFDSLVKQGKKVLKDAVADVQDASVPIMFDDYYVMWVATAKFSEDKREDNVYYVGAFQRWFNVTSGFIRWVVTMDQLARQTLGH